MAFHNCNGLQNLVLPSSVTSIGENAFYRCSATVTVDTNNSNYTILQNVLFSKDQKTLIQYPTTLDATNYSIPSTVKTIGQGAFQNNIFVKVLTIPTSVDTIKANAFRFCRSISAITIPSSVTFIDTAAFYGCTGLSKMYVNNVNPIQIDTIHNVFGGGVGLKICTLYVPLSSVNAYKESQWSAFKNIVGQ